MTHVKALQAGHSSQGTSEPITPVCDDILAANAPTSHTIIRIVLGMMYIINTFKVQIIGQIFPYKMLYSFIFPYIWSSIDAGAHRYILISKLYPPPPPHTSIDSGAHRYILISKLYPPPPHTSIDSGAHRYILISKLYIPPPPTHKHWFRGASIYTYQQVIPPPPHTQALIQGHIDIYLSASYTPPTHTSIDSGAHRYILISKLYPPPKKKIYIATQIIATQFLNNR